MAVYKLLFKESAQEDLRKLPNLFLRNIVRKISSLETDPFTHGHIKLSGSNDFYRIRSGDYIFS